MPGWLAGNPKGVVHQFRIKSIDENSRELPLPEKIIRDEEHQLLTARSTSTKKGELTPASPVLKGKKRRNKKIIKKTDLKMKIEEKVII